MIGNPEGLILQLAALSQPASLLLSFIAIIIRLILLYKNGYSWNMLSPSIMNVAFYGSSTCFDNVLHVASTGW